MGRGRVCHSRPILRLVTLNHFCRRWSWPRHQLERSTPTTRGGPRCPPPRARTSGWCVEGAIARRAQPILHWSLSKPFHSRSLDLSLFPPPTPDTLSDGGFQVMADYAPTYATALAARRGDTLQVLSKDNADWWRVRHLRRAALLRYIWSFRHHS